MVDVRAWLENRILDMTEQLFQTARTGHIWQVTERAANIADAGSAHRVLQLHIDRRRAESLKELAAPVEPPADPTGVDCLERYEGIQP
jgi:hypothetical protein